MEGNKERKEKSKTGLVAERAFGRCFFHSMCCAGGRGKVVNWGLRQAGDKSVRSVQPGAEVRRRNMGLHVCWCESQKDEDQGRAKSERCQRGDKREISL